MHAPRAKFERIYIISPIKVVVILLTSFHGLFILIALLASFWIETKTGHYGPLFRCERRLLPPKIIECSFGGFNFDIKLFSHIPSTTLLTITSFSFSILAILFASLSFTQTSFRLRHRYWLCTILLVLFIFLIDCFLLVFIPLIYQQYAYHLQWAYGVHAGGTLFIFVSLLSSIITHNTDDIEYLEQIEK